jgi:hypothetical protein
MKLNIPYSFSVARLAVALVVFAIVVGICVWHVAPSAARSETLSAAPRHADVACPSTWRPNESRSIEAYHQFDVPAGEFQETLQCFMNQSGLVVGWAVTLAPETVKTRAIREKNMRAIDALVRMVSGSKLEVLPSTNPRDTALWLVRRTDHRL